MRIAAPFSTASVEKRFDAGGAGLSAAATLLRHRPPRPPLQGPLRRRCVLVVDDEVRVQVVVDDCLRDLNGLSWRRRHCLRWRRRSGNGGFWRWTRSQREASGQLLAGFAKNDRALPFEASIGDQQFARDDGLAAFGYPAVKIKAPRGIFRILVCSAAAYSHIAVRRYGSGERFPAGAPLGITRRGQVPRRILKVIGRREWRIEHLAAIDAAVHVRGHV
jgi:hypothetical protein